MQPNWPGRTRAWSSHAPTAPPLRPEWISQRSGLLITQYTAIRHRHEDDGWEISQIAKRHRIIEAKVRAALSGGPLPPIRFHDLRHGTATLSLAAGVEMKVVSETLGHARSSFTADVYASVIPEVFKEAAEAAAALVPRRVGPPKRNQRLPRSTQDQGSRWSEWRRIGDLNPGWA